MGSGLVMGRMLKICTCYSFCPLKGVYPIVGKKAHKMKMVPKHYKISFLGVQQGIDGY